MAARNRKGEVFTATGGKEAAPAGTRSSSPVSKGLPFGATGANFHEEPRRLGP